MLPADLPMAVNGPSLTVGPELDTDLSPCVSPQGSQPSPVLQNSSPEGLSPPQGSVSPGKKRVRISDSTSVVMIENNRSAHHGDRDLDLIDPRESPRRGQDTSPKISSPRARRGLSFPQDSASGNSGILRKGGSEGSSSWEYGGSISVEYTDDSKEYHGSTSKEYSETITTVDQLTFPEIVPPTAVTSLESRDNPFLPGGELSKEAEELLKKATIVRDKFFLDDQGRQQPIPDRTDNSPTKNKEQTTHDAFDGSVPNATSTHTNAGPGVVEDRISPTSAGKAEAAPVAAPHPRENGKAGDAGTSPDNVKLDVGGSPTADGAKAGGGDSAGVGGDQQDKDKAKRRPKCCVVM